MGGLGHDFKAGVNWIHEPHLFTTFNGGSRAAAHAGRRRHQRARSATSSFSGGAADVNIPFDQYGFTSRTTGA